MRGGCGWVGHQGWRRSLFPDCFGHLVTVVFVGLVPGFCVLARFVCLYFCITYCVFIAVFVLRLFCSLLAQNCTADYRCINVLPYDIPERSTAAGKILFRLLANLDLPYLSAVIRWRIDTRQSGYRSDSDGASTS